MKKLFYLSFCLAAAGCASRTETVFTPVAVDAPVLLTCSAPQIEAPPDKMKNLSTAASLTEFTKICVEQTLLDRAALAQYRAALDACAAPPLTQTPNMKKDQ